MWGRGYGSIVEKFRTWAESNPEVSVAMIVGSQARRDSPADEWSDLDVAIFHADPPRLIASTDWFQQFGTVVTSMVEATAVGGSRERRVLFSDGRDVDFAVFPSTAIPFLVNSPEGLDVLVRGYVVLVDKHHELDDLASTIATRVPPHRGPNSKEEFLAEVSDFFYHVLWVAKKLRRGETWTAKMGCDGYLKQRLCRMIEWDAQVIATQDLDVWHDGRFLDRWAPPAVLARLPDTFAQYEAKDIARALHETGELYSQLARQIAEKREWSYPSDMETSVWELVRGTLAELPGRR